MVPLKWGETRIVFKGEGFIALEHEPVIVNDFNRSRKRIQKDPRKVVTLSPYPKLDQLTEIRAWLAERNQTPTLHMVRLKESANGEIEAGLSLEFSAIKDAVVFKMYWA